MKEISFMNVICVRKSVILKCVGIVNIMWSMSIEEKFNKKELMNSNMWSSFKF